MISEPALRPPRSFDCQQKIRAMLLSEVYDRCTWKSGLLGMQDYLDYVEVYDRCIVNPIIARPTKIRIFFDGFLLSCKNPRWICGEKDPTNTELALSLSDRFRFPWCVFLQPMASQTQPIHDGPAPAAWQSRGRALATSLLSQWPAAPPPTGLKIGERARFHPPPPGGGLCAANFL